MKLIGQGKYLYMLWYCLSSKNIHTRKYKKIFFLVLFLHLFVLYICIYQSIYDDNNSFINKKNEESIIDSKDIYIRDKKNNLLEEKYKNDIRACILPGIIYPKMSNQQLENNQTVEFLVKINEKNELDKLVLIKSSKNAVLDKAVEIGILRCDKFPTENGFNHERQIHIIYKIREE